MTKKLTARLSALLALLLSVLLGENTKTNAAQVPDNMVWIPPGTFTMGSPGNEAGRYWDETQHQVTITHGFYIFKFETTQEEYVAIIGKNPSRFTWNPKLPVEQVSWEDATNYCWKLTQSERGKGYLPVGYVYRLPTESEWEYACRAGTTTRFSYGDDQNYSELTNYAWYRDNSDVLFPTENVRYGLPLPTKYPTTHIVGTKLPNPWGIYDMYGNVWEWCSDWYGPYPTNSVTDPQGPARGVQRTPRGSCYGRADLTCRSAQRNCCWPTGLSLYETGIRPLLAWDFSIPPIQPIEPPKKEEPKPTLVLTPEQKGVIEKQTVQPTYSEPLKKEVGKDSLVVVTHGWNPDVKWLDEMTNAIITRLSNDKLNNWQVYAHKWVEKAQTPIWMGFIGAEIVLHRGRDEGNDLANTLTKQGWKHIHFIGHSAGAAVIQTAATLIKENDLTITVHTTFLDPFVGLTYGGRNTYGAGSDFSDNYFARDAETIDILAGLTGGQLNFAYNVDVTFLDTNKVSRGTFRSSWNGDIEQCYQTVTSHKWAHEFYLKTIRESWPKAKGFGFPLSKAGGNWDFAVSQYKERNNPPFPLGTPDPSCVPDTTPPPPSINPFLDLAKPLLIKSPTGTSEVKGNGLKLITGSPVWVAVATEVTNSVNLLSLEAGFFSGAGAEGLLSVYWNTNVLGSIDERVSPKLRQYTFALPTKVTSGTYTLGFRLDPFSAISSSAVVTNVALGFAGIKEPFSLSATGSYTNGLPILQLRGQAGFNYKVESSTDLINWSTLAVLLNTNGTVRFTDSTSTSAFSRFYRAVAP